jgi:hypothetical protein
MNPEVLTDIWNAKAALSRIISKDEARSARGIAFSASFGRHMP